jgi:hypothetical protein
LVAELDLEGTYGLSVALESKVTWLDDAGMHGADGDFVDRWSFDTEEGMRARDTPALGCEPPVLTQGFEPRMPLRLDGVVLEELALEGLRLGELRGEGGIASRLRDRHGRQSDLRPCVVSKNAEELRRRPGSRTGAPREGAQGQEPPAVRTQAAASAPEERRGKAR